jgi:hypothetical protein
LHPACQDRRPDLTAAREFDFSQTPQGDIMAIHWSVIHTMESLKMFPAKGSVLDIGCSNLYGAEAPAILDFVQRHQPGVARDEAWAASLAARSGYRSDGMALNQAFIGELLEAAGMSYAAVDIASSYKTTILDLNRETLPEGLVGQHDLVINAGTTEHILNQANAFSAIHDAAKVGGLIYHQVPAAGFAAHGYYCYTGKFFLDLGAYNHYELLDFWFDGPAGHDNLLDAVEGYKVYFPILGSYTGNRTAPREARVNATPVPNMAVNVLYRRTSDKPFAGLLDVSTSVGSVGQSIFESYGRGLGTRIMSKVKRVATREWLAKKLK